eukprot:CCRYP_005278-RA/>CCRYP_005278-RA protein AED:0.37 eAED:0.37 QI:949/0.5/0.6/1/0/0/5/0/89
MLDISSGHLASMIAGKTKAPVFPDPVGAHPITSRKSINEGIACIWMGDCLVNLRKDTVCLILEEWVSGDGVNDANNSQGRQRLRWQQQF